MKQNQISEISKKLNRFNLANLMNVNVEKINNAEYYYYNIVDSMSFSGLANIPRAHYEEYIVQEEDEWSLIAWKFFEDIRLWWVICKFNDIDNPIISPVPGTIIKIPNSNIIKLVTQALKNAR